MIGRVRFNSVYLWGYLGDLGKALSEVHTFLSVFFGPYIALDQSGLDLAADVLWFDETMDAQQIKEHFISRAVLDDERPVYLDDGYVDGPSCIHRRWKKISGLSFGLHTSATSAVIYNKTAEINYHSPEKGWFVDLWRHRAALLGIEYHEQMTVWRIEVRFQRTAFREFPDVSGAYDVLEHLRDLWAYGVGHPGGGADGLPDGWLRCVIPSEDTNRARWPVTPAWEVVQHAFDPEPWPLSAYEQQEQEKEALLQEVDAYLEAHPMAPRETVLTRRPRQEAGVIPLARGVCLSEGGALCWSVISVGGWRVVGLLMSGDETGWCLCWCVRNALGAIVRGYWCLGLIFVLWLVLMALIRVAE